LEKVVARADLTSASVKVRWVPLVVAAATMGGREAAVRAVAPRLSLVVIQARAPAALRVVAPDSATAA
jgi:hypothetical protein